MIPYPDDVRAACAHALAAEVRFWVMGYDGQLLTPSMEHRLADTMRRCAGRYWDILRGCYAACYWDHERDGVNVSVADTLPADPRKARHFMRIGEHP